MSTTKETTNPTSLRDCVASIRKTKEYARIIKRNEALGDRIERLFKPKELEEYLNLRKKYSKWFSNSATFEDANQLAKKIGTTFDVLMQATGYYERCTELITQLRRINSEHSKLYSELRTLVVEQGFFSTFSKKQDRDDLVSVLNLELDEVYSEFEVRVQNLESVMDYLKQLQFNIKSIMNFIRAFDPESNYVGKT